MTLLADAKPGRIVKVVQMGMKGPAGRRYREMSMVKIEPSDSNLSLRKRRPNS